MYAFELTTATDFANRTMGFRTTRCRAALTTPLFVSLGVCVLAISCQREGDTIWSAELRSPDGRWIASARTIENSGFGTGSIQTNVYLKRTSGSTSPETILSFFHDASPGSRSSRTAASISRYETFHPLKLCPQMGDGLQAHAPRGGLGREHRGRKRMYTSSATTRTPILPRRFWVLVTMLQRRKSALSTSH
jgi:hypothetical protein